MCSSYPDFFIDIFFFFKIIVKPSRKVKFSTEKQKDMSDDGKTHEIEISADVSADPKLFNIFSLYVFGKTPATVW